LRSGDQGDAMQGQERKRILLVDDDTSLLVTLGDFLEFEGYDVTTAESGEQALTKLPGMDPDLIILDMSMPGMGGVGFLKEISGADGKPEHPVLVLTARANMAEFFADMDVDGFVAKPCDPSDLLMEVSRIVFLRSGEKLDGKLPRTAKRKVLIAEDEGGGRERIAAAFKAEGYVVSTVSSGPEVLEKAIVERPDAIVLKLILSNMNGDAVAGMLREMPNTKHIPVVLYDTTNSIVDTGKYTRPGSVIRKVVKGNAPEALVAAAAEMLKEE